MICLQFAKDFFLDHHSIYIFNSKEKSPKALDYHDKKIVDEELILNKIGLLTQGSEVLFEGQRYSVGHVVMMGFYNNDYLFSLFKPVLVFRGQTFLVSVRSSQSVLFHISIIQN